MGGNVPMKFSQVEIGNKKSMKKIGSIMLYVL